MNKPARLDKTEPITVHLTPSIIIAGAVLILIMLSLGLGFIDNYNYLLGGI